MFVIKALFKGISGLLLMLSLAMSFAPATQTELAALGPDYGRREIAQHRLATGALKLEKFGLLDAIASTSDDLDTNALRLALQSITHGQRSVALLAAPEPQQDISGFGEARSETGARFITVD